MRRVTRNGVIAIAAASGAMAVTMPAYADSAADGAAADSPGVLSGNTVQLPAHVPVNVCGNTVNVVGLLNPAVGNKCANEDGEAKPGGASDGGASADGSGKDSPGVGSGNVVQLPVHLPVNVSGNSVNVVGVGNAAIGNESVNGPGKQPPATTRPDPKPSAPRARHPRPVPPAHVPHGPRAALAHTGADQTLPTVAGAAALALGGVVLYRRFRPKAVR
ncbi:chaplin [Streptomyces ferrugineus]|uniref:Chaplin n=1 Tax=Streptomyces ferrugineus TaxID=1413221 RepID=A0A7M2SCY8_9ACTN|nr:chaplin [Streptomyces ferrugineus]QOV33645.1 chaplin [Streptomyces ferrugineus]